MLGAIDFTVEHPKYWSELGKSKELAFDDAMKFISYLRHKHKGLVSFDTETESLAKRYNRLVSIQLGIDDKTGYVICLDSPYTDYSPSQIIKVKSALKELFEDENTHIAWVGHNAQFDVCQGINQLGIKYIAKPIIDTMLFIHLLDENRIQKFRDDENGNKVKCSAALKSVCNEFFQFKLYDKEAIEARKNENLLLLPKDKFVVYAGMDAYVTFRLFSYLKLVAEKYDYYDKAKRLLVYLISPSIKMLSWVSSNGFCVDVKHLKYLLSNESPIMERINEIESIYRSTEECIKVNEELYNVQSKSVSLFGMTTPWILDLNKPAHRVALFYTSKKGFKLTPVKDKKAKGKFSTGKLFQKAYSGKNNIVHLYEEEQGLKKLKSSYLNSIWKCMIDNSDTKDGRVRANFVMNGTVTGRICSCIRKGTKIEVVRDISKYPYGINIEDVKPGDYVYCYDKNCNPTIKKVKSLVYRGKKKVIRVHWRQNSNKKEGYLDCTPDHRIRLSNGDYVRADELNIYDSVLSMSRKNKGDFIYFTGHNGILDHRFIYRKIFGKFDNNLIIHHIDGNHYNNVPTNLMAMDRDEHSELHSSTNPRVIDKKERNEISIRSKNLWKNDEFRKLHSGKNAPNYKELTRKDCIKLLFKYSGNPTRIANNRGWDYTTLMKKIAENGINWRNIKFRFGDDDKRITKDRIMEAISNSINMEEASKKLRVGSRKFKDLCSLFGIKYGFKSKKSYQKSRKEVKRNRSIYIKDGNHRILYVENLGIKDYVYDIEVEGCHNFIANGLSVHNCNPNLQQIPRSDSPLKKSVKCLYRAEPSEDKDDPNVLLQADFCANEIRFWAAISGDPYLCNSFNESYKKGQMFRANPTDEKLEEEAHLLGDIHKQTAAKMYDIPIKEVTKDLRQTAKSLSLGIMYQRGEKSVAQQLNITPEQAHEKFEIFFKNYGVGVAWSESMKKMVNKYGYVISPLGRMRRLGDLIIEGKKLIEKSKEFPRGSGEGKRLWIEGSRLIGRAERRSVNSPIQGLASDLALVSLSLLHKYIIKNDLKWKIVNSVHDSVVIELPSSQVMKASKVIRKIFTEDSRKYVYKYFGWKMPTHIDIDFEVGQNKCWKCSKCGSLVNYWKKACDHKDKEGKMCGCMKLVKHKLNMGYGTLVGFDETVKSFDCVRQGF